ncbi:MAG: triose-phosphate isomerase [Patescibacteria group bacterium]
MNKIIIANWKAHPDTLAEAQALFETETEAAAKYPNIKTVICPPAEFVKELGANGTQDIFWTAGGDNFGVQYVLVGHSDRRYPPTGGGDTDEIINRKLKIALNSGVTPILLIGEKTKGDNRQAVLGEQLNKNLANLITSQVVNILICYEPVWAISASPGAEPDKPENTLAAVEIIARLTGKKTILYGGSVNSANVGDFLKHSEISGAIVGQASLDAVQFEEVLKVVSAL